MKKGLTDDSVIIGSGILLIFIILITFIATSNNTPKKERDKEQTHQTSEQNDRPILAKHEYVVKFTGDEFHASTPNTDIELGGGDPSFSKGFAISVPSEYRFVGTNLYVHTMLDRDNSPRRYIFAQFYKDGKLVYESDTATYRGIAYMDLP